MAQVYIAYARPIGEDGDVFWMAAGTTQEKAFDRLLTKIVDGWRTDDEDETPEEREARMRAEVDDPHQWEVLWDEDVLE